MSPDPASEARILHDWAQRSPSDLVALLERGGHLLDRRLSRGQRAHIGAVLHRAAGELLLRLAREQSARDHRNERQQGKRRA